MHPGWVTPKVRALSSGPHRESGAVVHKNPRWQRRECKKSVGSSTEECNQRAFYYVTQRGHGTLRPFPSRVIRLGARCMPALILDRVSVCVCLDECTRIPLVLLHEHATCLHAYEFFSVRECLDCRLWCFTYLKRPHHCVCVCVRTHEKLKFRVHANQFKVLQTMVILCMHCLRNN